MPVQSWGPRVTALQMPTALPSQYPNPFDGQPVAPVGQVNDPFAEPDPANYAMNPTDPRSIESFDMWRKLATAQGPTRFGREALSQIQASKADQLAALPQQQAAQLGAATSQLASRGGLRGTMGSRLASEVGNQGIMATQGIHRGSQNRILDALRQDEALKLDATDKWAGLENQYAQQNQDAAMRKYQLDLAKWAAGLGSEAYKTVTNR